MVRMRAAPRSPVSNLKHSQVLLLPPWRKLDGGEQGRVPRARLALPHPGLPVSGEGVYPSRSPSILDRRSRPEFIRAPIPALLLAGVHQ